MREIKYLKELGHEKSIALLGYSLLFIVTVKCLKKPISNLFNNFRSSINNLFQPTFYETIPDWGKQWFNNFEAVYSFVSLTVPALMITLVLLALSRPNLDISAEQGAQITALISLSVLLLSLGIANGNKAILRNRDLHRAQQKAIPIDN